MLITTVGVHAVLVAAEALERARSQPVPPLAPPRAPPPRAPLPTPPERCHILLDSKPAWVPVPAENAANRHFPEYPDEALIDWHRRHGLITD